MPDFTSEAVVSLLNEVRIAAQQVDDNCPHGHQVTIDFAISDKGELGFGVTLKCSLCRQTVSAPLMSRLAQAVFAREEAFQKLGISLPSRRT